MKFEKVFQNTIYRCRQVKTSINFLLTMQGVEISYTYCPDMITASGIAAASNIIKQYKSRVQRYILKSFTSVREQSYTNTVHF